MPVIKKDRITSLSAEGMNEFEKQVTNFERLSRKLERMDGELERKRKRNITRGGIYGAPKKRGLEDDYVRHITGSMPSEFQGRYDTDPPSMVDLEYSTEKALPRATKRKQKRLKEAGLWGGRLETDQHEAKGNLAREKVRPEYEENKNVVDAVMMALGVKRTWDKKVKKTSLVGGEGRPIRAFDNEFTKLRNKVYFQEKILNGFGKAKMASGSLIQGGSGLIQGASSITREGLISMGISGISRIPVVGWIIAAAVGVSLGMMQAYMATYGPGGTRDKRKLVKASDIAIIGVEHENKISSGEILFLSNPGRLQGLPYTNSNTMDRLEGVSRFRQRHQGEYV